MIRTAAVLVLLLSSSSLLFAGADLHIGAEHGPTRLPVGGVFALRVTVSNFGPGDAVDSRLTLTGIETIHVEHPLPPGCARDQGSVECRLDTIPSGLAGVRTLYFRLVGPRATASPEVQVSVTSATEDPNPGNNSIRRSYEFIDSVQFAGDITVTSRRADPGETVQVVTSIRNYIDSNPGDVRIRYSVDQGTIRSIEAGPRWNCSTDGATAECVAASLEIGCRCSGDITLGIQTPSDPFGGTSKITMTAASSLPDFSQPMMVQAALTVYRWMIVDTTAPGGEGSLRDTIWRVNEECGDEPCKIAFAIDRAELIDGVAVITPLEPLPVIMARNVHLDGSTQALHAGDTNPYGPEVMIDGRFLTVGRGIEMHSSCDAIIEGLVLVNFPNEAIVYDNRERCTVDRIREIRGNYVGVDPTGREARPNRRGVYAAGDWVDLVGNVISGNVRAGAWGHSLLFRAYENRIGTSADGTLAIPNGASGIYVTPRSKWAEVLRNEISWNVEMGVAVARTSGYVDIRQNAMRGNGGLGIDVGLDGYDGTGNDETVQSDPPLLLSAVYDATAGVTTVTGILATEPLGPYGNAVYIDLYANDSPDADGEEWIFYSWGPPILSDGTPFVLTVTRDLRGRWINATSTRVHFTASTPGDGPAAASIAPSNLYGGDAKTSELSAAIQVTE